MSKIGMLLSAASIMAAASESRHYRGHDDRVYTPQAEPNWKRKKCKSCTRLGMKCNPYVYSGTTFYRHSKPNHQACKEYQKRKITKL